MAAPSRRPPLFNPPATAKFRRATRLTVVLCVSGMVLTLHLLRPSSAPALLSGGAAQQAAAAVPCSDCHQALPYGGVRLAAAPGQLHARGPTLVVYVFSGTDPEYEANLRFFLREAVKADDGCEYIIVLQEGAGLSQPTPLPELPPNARYVPHENRCFDIGTVGWVLDTQLRPGSASSSASSSGSGVSSGNSGGDPLERYQYFVWVNSSVRGPFLPHYLRGRMHWTEPFLSRLSPRVKLVGPTASCDNTLGIPAAPHVQSYAVATDATGLAVLRAAGVFQCFERMGDVIRASEIGGSTAILHAGYTIDCFMARYQGMDWSDPSLAAQPCNRGMNPLQPGSNDGLSVDPFEVLFIKVKGTMLAAGNWPHAAAAAKLDAWLAAADAGGATAKAATAANYWLDVAAPAIREDALRRGQACFDHAFYIRSSPYDLGFMASTLDPARTAWQHFLSSGFHDGRPHRFTC